ncbi:exonuclease domain-containing protein [Arthrobacter halodurans]|uniref:Exonuclease domain-containing protein n=1 Tax=Arthrobacter halodurans TaxID=516699 RepID=A0ABV4UJE1_9MICC
MNFTTIDVETANSSRGSVCAVGMCQVRGGKIVKTMEWYVRPPGGMDSFDPRNTSIHGITAEMVREASTWAASLETIRGLAESYPLIAYNAAFDRSAIVQASESVGLLVPSNDFHCALLLTRRVLALEAYKLPLVAQELGIDEFEHHRPGADAVACAQVVLALAGQEGARTVDDLWPPTSTPAPRTKSANYWSQDAKARVADLPQPNPEAPTDHPFHGHQVIFTGELQALGRWEAMELVAHQGGNNGKSVTKKTGFLVVSGAATVDEVNLATGTTKERKAATYIAQGQEIRVLTEHEFLQLAGSPLRDFAEVSSDTPIPVTPDRTPATINSAPRFPVLAGETENHVSPMREVPVEPGIPPRDPQQGERHGQGPQDAPRALNTTPSARGKATKTLLGIVLWVGALIGGIGAALFAAVGIELLGEGTTGAGWTGLVFACLCAALVFACVRGLVRRGRRAKLA